MKEIDIIVDSYDYERGPDVRAAIHDLPAYEALRAQVVVMNSHYAGPPSQTIDFLTPEGGQSRCSLYMMLRQSYGNCSKKNCLPSDIY